MSETNKTKTNYIIEKFLFGYARILALAGSLLAALGIVILLVSLFWPDNSSHVSLSDLRLNQQEQGEENTPSKIDIEFPAIVKKYLSGDNDKIVYGWLEDLDEKGHRDFLKNLSSILSEAERKNEGNALSPGAVNDLFNNYRDVKLQILEKSSFDVYETMIKTGAKMMAIFGLTLLIVLMSLILLLLAIERNTRKDLQP